MLCFPTQQADSEAAGKRLALSVVLAALPPDPVIAARLARANRMVDDDVPDNFIEHEWRTVISSDGVTCEVCVPPKPAFKIRKPSRARTAAPTILAPSDTPDEREAA